MDEKPCDGRCDKACAEEPVGMTPLSKALLVIMVAAMVTAGFVDLEVLKAVVMGAINVLQ